MSRSLLRMSFSRFERALMSLIEHRRDQPLRSRADNHYESVQWFGEGPLRVREFASMQGGAELGLDRVGAVRGPDRAADTIVASASEF